MRYSAPLFLLDFGEGFFLTHFPLKFSEVSCFARIFPLDVGEVIFLLTHFHLKFSEVSYFAHIFSLR